MSMSMSMSMSRGRKIAWSVIALMLLSPLLLSLTYRPIRVRVLAHLGRTEAMYELGDAYESISGKGLVAHTDMREAYYWWERAARAGHTKSMYALFQCNFDRGQSGWPYIQKWIPKGAKLGDPNCMGELGKAYKYGLYGFPKDPEEARYWYAKAEEIDRKRWHGK